MASSAARVVTRPRRTSVRSLRSRAGSMSVHVRAVPARLLRAAGRRKRGLGSALELLQIAQEERLHLRGGLAVVHLAAQRGVVVEAAHVPGDMFPHEHGGIVPLLRGQIMEMA